MGVPVRNLLSRPLKPGAELRVGWFRIERSHRPLVCDALVVLSFSTV